MGETVTGVQSIRAYGVQSKFIQMLENKINYNQKSTYAGIIADRLVLGILSNRLVPPMARGRLYSLSSRVCRWLAIRLEMVGGIITFFTAIFAVFARDTLSAGLVGLAVSYAMQVSDIPIARNVTSTGIGTRFNNADSYATDNTQILPLAENDVRDRDERGRGRTDQGVRRHGTGSPLGNPG